MSDVVIKAESLGKKYVIGHKTENGRYTALRDVLMQNVHSVLHKTRDMVQGKPLIQGDTLEELWALKDVSFEIRRGEVVGIIGRNGAGKSTLLKILSRITEPSVGRVTIKGRVASLLEVGTGFHPELTGRENIYLNGAVLGMKKAEIDHKFDDIVSFAEVEKFIDTPMKRYSSGMSVRLAFAVSAHLDPTILLVDEVLAVGDMEFQKKCLGTMDTVAKSGRTVLFVSHNMGAIQSLCTRSLLLAHGNMVLDDVARKVVLAYLKADSYSEGEKLWPAINKAPGDNYVRVNAVRVVDREGKTRTNFDVRDHITVEIKYWVLKKMNSLNTSLRFSNHRGEIIFHSRNDSMNSADGERERLPGYYVSRCYIPPDLMNEARVFVQAAVTDEIDVHFLQGDIVSFTVNDRMDPEGVRGNYIHEWPTAAVRPWLEWTVEKYPLTYPLEVKGEI